MKNNILLLSCLVIWFLPIANFRLIDGDEGFYLYAAKLVSEGKIVYKDFFYPQAPLLPYIYKWWFYITGISWFNARLLQAIVTALIGFILFKNLLRINKKVAKFGLFLFLFSGYITGWFTIAKAYAIPVLLIIIACELIQSKIFSKHLINMLFIGTLLGLAINIRLYMIVLVPIFYIYALKRFISHKTLIANSNVSRDASFLPSFLYLIVGLVIALSPNIFFLSDIDTYLFNNIGYHAIRTNAGLVGNISQKLQNLLDISLDVQFIIITLISIYSTLYKIKNKKLPPMYAIVGIAIILVSFLPTPAVKQYFAMSIPFLIIASAPILYYLYKKGNWRKIAIIGFTASYFFVGIFELYRFLYWGENVPGVDTHGAASRWQIRTVKKVSKRLDALIQDNETIITWWPGYLLETKKAIIFPRMENHFGIMVADSLTSDQRVKYKIISSEELKEEISSKKVKTILIGNWFTGNLDPKMDIIEKGYHVIATVDYAAFLKLNEK